MNGLIMGTRSGDVHPSIIFYLGQIYDHRFHSVHRTKLPARQPEQYGGAFQLPSELPFQPLEE